MYWMYADLSSGLLTIRKRLKSYSFMGAALCLTMANKNSPIFKGIPRAFLSMSERDISGATGWPSWRKFKLHHTLCLSQAHTPIYTRCSSGSQTFSWAPFWLGLPLGGCSNRKDSGLHGFQSYGWSDYNTVCAVKHNQGGIVSQTHVLLANIKGQGVKYLKKFNYWYSWTPLWGALLSSNTLFFLDLLRSQRLTFMWFLLRNKERHHAFARFLVKVVTFET